MGIAVVSTSPKRKSTARIDAGSMPPLRSLDGQLSIFPHGAPESVGDAGLEVERAERGIAGIARTPPLWRRRCCGGTGWPPHFEIVASVTRSVQTPTGCRARLELVPAIGHLGNDSPQDLDGGWSRKGRPASNIRFCRDRSTGSGDTDREPVPVGLLGYRGARRGGRHQLLGNACQVPVGRSAAPDLTCLYHLFSSLCQ